MFRRMKYRLNYFCSVITPNLFRDSSRTSIIYGIVECYSFLRCLKLKLTLLLRRSKVFIFIYCSTSIQQLQLLSKSYSLNIPIQKPNPLSDFDKFQYHHIDKHKNPPQPDFHLQRPPYPISSPLSLFLSPTTEPLLGPD